MKNLSISRLSLALAVAVLSVVPAFAQAPAGFDYAGLATGARTEVNGAISAVAPVALALMATLLGVGMIWKWIKKGAKSS